MLNTQNKSWSNPKGMFYVNLEVITIESHVKSPCETWGELATCEFWFKRKVIQVFSAPLFLDVKSYCRICSIQEGLRRTSPHRSWLRFNMRGSKEPI